MQSSLQAQKELTVMFYNCENFFDTFDDPKTKDEEFLPNSEMQWDIKKYNNKIKRLAEVMDSTVAGIGLPDVIGVCEIENKTVLTDLVAKSNLKNRNYKSIVSTGLDERGINVGLMYDETIFKFESSEELNATNPEIEDYKTRNILCVNLTHRTSGEIFYFFVNHWPSRRDGEKETEAKRLYAAKILKAKINSLQLKNPKVKLIAMGDFNDTPINNSIFNTLQANSKPKANELLNPFLEYSKHEQGTHYYQGKWQMFDQIIMSPSCTNGKQYNFKTRNAFILKKDFVLFKNYKTGEVKPNRTYGPGNKYYNGYSDHLAVYIKLN